MAGHRLGSIAAAVVLAATVGLVSGCQSDGPGPVVPSAEASPEPSATTSPPEATECLAAERRVARDIGIAQAVWEVTGAATGDSPEARHTVERETARAERRLIKNCDGQAPPAFAQFAAEIQPLVTADSFGNMHLDEVLAAWLRWGTEVGRPRAALREVQQLETCRTEVFPRFDATFRVWWEWTATGKAWWVELTFDNRTGGVLGGGMDGAAEVTKLLDDPFGWEDGPEAGPGRDEVVGWGGSSAEVLELQPGTTTLLAAPGVDQDVHTTADGTLRVTYAGVNVGTRSMRHTCSVPVRQRR